MSRVNGELVCRRSETGTRPQRRRDRGWFVVVESSADERVLNFVEPRWGRSFDGEQDSAVIANDVASPVVRGPILRSPYPASLRHGDPMLDLAYLTAPARKTVVRGFCYGASGRRTALIDVGQPHEALRRWPQGIDQPVHWCLRRVDATSFAALSR